jgi:hypothetical protein
MTRRGNNARDKLLQVELGLFAGNKAVENRQNPFPILVNPVEISPKCALKILGLHPFVDNYAGDVNILTKRVKRMSSQEKTIEERSLALRGQRVEIVSRSHLVQDSCCKKDILAMVRAIDQVFEYYGRREWKCRHLKSQKSLDA